MNYNIKCLLLVTILCSLLQGISAASWYDASWPLKQEINLSTNGSAPMNYSVLLSLNSSLVGSGFNWNNECSLNSTKIRFANSMNTYFYPFWVENCSSVNQEMNIWIRINDSEINSSGLIIPMYYNNIATSYKRGNASNVFEFFANFSNYSVESEAAGQDISGGVSIEEQGSQISGTGNFWKVYSGFDTINILNTGTQILELDMFSNDCGEISALKFDTDATQEDVAAYRFCGSQTNWGIVPDQAYSSLGTWSRVFSILDDFTYSGTHLHIVGDDDADASTDTIFRNIKIRKYITNEPQATFGLEYAINTTLTSLSPNNMYVTSNATVTFTCFAGTGNATELQNISLYGNWGSGWERKQTQLVSGNVNSSIFVETLPLITNTYSWNCEVQDQAGGYDMFDTNYTISIDLDPPVLTLFSPLGTINDPTPLLNISSDKIVNLSYRIDSGPYISLCLLCNETQNISEHVAEGSYTIDVFATDSLGNSNTISSTFTLDLNNSYTDYFNDESSIELLNNSQIEQSRLIFNGRGSKYYQGIQFGYSLGNLQYIGNQWGGSANGGEVDIECPGGDSNCWFINQNGTNITSLDIANGVVTLDSDSSTIGFIMYSEEDVHTRLSPAPHAQEGDNFVAVCYSSGQWYYDDNNGCNKPFTPRPSDVLLANLTWGISSVSSLEGANTFTKSEVISKAINVSQPIVIFDNITWDEYNTTSNNNLSLEISVDDGITWYNVSQGIGFSNFTNGSSLKFKVIFLGDGTSTIGFDNLKLNWRNYLTQKPNITLLTPSNNSKIIQNENINFSYVVSDDNSFLNCVFYLNGIINTTHSCQNNNISSLLLNLTKGEYTWSINVTDFDNNSVIKTHSFQIINPIHKKISKRIITGGSNLYHVSLQLENYKAQETMVMIEEEYPGLTYGSFSPSFTSTFNLNSNTFYFFNRSGSPYELLNYSIAKSPMSSFEKVYRINLE